MLQLLAVSVEREKAEPEDEFQNCFNSWGNMGYCVSFSTGFASVDDSDTSYCAKIHIESDAAQKVIRWLRGFRLCRLSVRTAGHYPQS